MVFETGGVSMGEGLLQGGFPIYLCSALQNFWKNQKIVKLSIPSPPQLDYEELPAVPLDREKLDKLRRNASRDSLVM